ncbi:unnamed protein product [Urochloa humidicola]
MAGSAPLEDGGPAWGTDRDEPSRSRPLPRLAGAPLPGLWHLRRPAPSSTGRAYLDIQETALHLRRTHTTGICSSRRRRTSLGPRRRRRPATPDPRRRARTHLFPTPDPRRLAASPAVPNASTRASPTISPAPWSSTSRL